MSADISMAYNNVRILPEVYCYQKYLWEPTLTDVERAVVIKLI